MIVRGMEAGDADAVARLCRQLGYERTEEHIGEWLTMAASAKTEQAAFVACVDDEVVGWIEVSVERRLQSEPFAMIGGLVVKDGERGRGIGRILCEHAEAWAWEKGLGTIRVTSRSTREGAHRFYLRDGYTQLKTSLVFEKKRQV